MNPNQSHVVYRCYDQDDRLLYIGCTHDINLRLGVHQSSWSNPASAALNLRMTRCDTTEYPNKAMARKAEREAIYNEAPLFNQHHQKVSRTKEQRLQDIEDYLQETRVPLNVEAVGAWERIGLAFSNPIVVESESA